MTNISMSIVNMLYNAQLMKYARRKRCCSIWCSDVCQYDFSCSIYWIFHGYSAYYRICISAPIIYDELKGLLKKKFFYYRYFLIMHAWFLQKFWLIRWQICLQVRCRINKFNNSRISVFFLSLSYLRELLSMDPLSLLCLTTDFISALYFILRTLVFQIAAVLILPAFLGIDGIWISIVAAEIMSMIITIIFNYKK